MPTERSCEEIQNEMDEMREELGALSPKERSAFWERARRLTEEMFRCSARKGIIRPVSFPGAGKFSH